MNIVATGQLTIMDYNDAPMLTGLIGLNSTKTQGYNPDANAYMPDWTKTPLKLVAVVNRSGSNDNIVNSINVDSKAWYKWNQSLNGGAGDWEKIMPASFYTEENMKSMDPYAKNFSETYAMTPNGSTLTINENMVDEGSWEFKFACRYTDPSSGLAIPFETTVSLVKVSNGTGLADAVIFIPEGNIFKNTEDTVLPIECSLWKGSNVYKDFGTVGNVHPDNFIAWFKADEDGIGDSNFGVAANDGWSRIVSDITWDGAKGVSRLMVPRDEVLNVEVFMCVIKDPESVGPGKSPIYYRDTATLIDQTDPINVWIDSSGGTVFKNGLGRTALTAILRQNGSEIDAKVESYSNQMYRYMWYKRNQQGDLENWYKDNQRDSEGRLISEGKYREGKTIELTGDNVDSSTNFYCNVVKKEQFRTRLTLKRQ